MIFIRTPSPGRLGLIAGSFAILAALVTLAAPPTLARGGGPNITNSPGYLRALEESRRQRAVVTQPYAAPAKRRYRRVWRRR
jgi:hypothetical protein